MGIVENANDPLKLGRCQVRIHGVHSDNKNLVPTEDLPWALSQAPSNASKLFSTFVEGDYVFGMFPAGMVSQQPIITGTIPGFLANAAQDASAYLTQKDMPDNLPGRGTLGVPTIGALARGDIANTKVAITNSTLAHSCDFRFFVDLQLDLGLPINPVTAMQEAIRSGKNKAALAMGVIMRQIAAQLRKVINLLLSAIGLDKTGELSKIFSYSKDIFRQVNYYIKEAAKVVEMASFYYNFVKDITEIVDYLKKLPDYLKSAVQGCISQFLNSINNFVEMVKSIPGLVGNNIDALLAQLKLDSQSSVDGLNNELSNSANANNSVVSSNTASDIVTTVTINQMDEKYANTVLKFVQDNYANANVVIINATANNFSKDSLQSP